MPLSPEHKAKSRETIIEAARQLFNIHGFQGVTIDMIMNEAGLTRGGFYNHFKNKDELYSIAVRSFLMGRGAQWRAQAGIDPRNLSPEMAGHMLDSYLGQDHLDNVKDQCPMIALPSDISRESKDVQHAYQELLTAMVWLFENTIEGDEKRRRALSMAALSIGGMILARALPDSGLATEVRHAANHTARQL